MKKLRNSNNLLIIIFGVSIILFCIIYYSNTIKVENPTQNIDETDTSISDWTLDNSAVNNMGLNEDSNIYEENSNDDIYDVYLTVFETKDENGEVLEFSDFSKHVYRDHTYNPVLNSHITILNEGEKLDPMAITNQANSTIRVRGNSARGDVYKSYKVKMDDDVEPFFGQSTLNINKHTEDSVKITTKLLTDLLIGVDDLVSFRTSFLRVWIRDGSLPTNEQEYEYYGLYTHTEQPNNSYLEARGLPLGNMYKARNFSFLPNENLRNVDDPLYDEELFEQILTIREGDDHTKLLEMIDAVNDTTRNFEEVFNTYFDEDNYLTWLCFNLLAGGQDILNHNYLLYSPNNSMKWYILPWDFDSNLQERDFQNELNSFDPASSTSIAPSLLGGQKLVMSTLHKRYFRIPGNIEKINLKMEEMMNDVFNEDKINELTDSYIPVLEKTITLHPDLELLKETPPETIDLVETMHEAVLFNYESFKYAFEFPTPMFVSMPTKTSSGTLQLSWEPSFSYDQKAITYNVRIASDYNMKNVLYEQNNIVENEIEVDIPLENGIYYLEVMAVDSDGDAQYSLEHYEFAGKLFRYANGILEFTIE